MLRIAFLPFATAHLLALVVECPNLVEAALPVPSGVHAVGTTILHPVNRQHPAGHRTLTAQLWYPCEQPQSPTRAPYLPDPGLRQAMVDTEYYGQSKEVIDAMGELKSSASLDAEPLKGDASWPVVLVSHGLGVSRANYTAFAQEWASHGYVVVTIDHPHGGLMVTNAGEVLTPQDHPAAEAENTFETMASEWSQDMSFLLDHFESAGDSNAVVAKMDLEKVAVAGHSLGGVAAIQGANQDARILAAVNFDGAPLGDIANTGIQAPTLILKSHPDYSDADLEKRGRTREGWDAMGQQFQKVWDDFLAKAQSTTYSGSIRGTGHVSYSDAPFVMPTTITQFGGKILDFDRAFEIACEVVLAFLDQELKAEPEPHLPELRERYPELSLKVMRVTP